MQQPSQEQFDDEDLVNQVRSGADTLWEELAVRVVSMITPIVLRKVAERDREDVIQEALIRFYTALPSYDRGRGTVSTFVSVLAHRQVADYYRRTGRDPDITDIEDLSEILEEVAEYANPGPSLLGDLEAHVGPEAWNIIQARMDGYSWAEVASAEGCTVAAAKMRQRRTLGTMRDYLESIDVGL